MTGDFSKKHCVKESKYEIGVISWKDNLLCDQICLFYSRPFSKGTCCTGKQLKWDSNTFLFNKLLFPKKAGIHERKQKVTIFSPWNDWQETYQLYPFFLSTRAISERVLYHYFMAPRFISVVVEHFSLSLSNFSITWEKQMLGYWKFKYVYNMRKLSRLVIIYFFFFYSQMYCHTNCYARFPTSTLSTNGTLWT